MTACATCKFAADMQEPELHEECEWPRHVDPASGVEVLGCVCQHIETEKLPDGTVAPKGVRKVMPR